MINDIYLETEELYKVLKKFNCNSNFLINKNENVATLDETAIDVQNLTLIYPDGTKALDNISLKINKGEFIGIIGVNGSGKTTLVKTFNGLLKPTKGKVIVLGKDINEWDSEEIVRKVGYVFQNPIHQISSRTVYDEVSFGLNNINIPKSEIKNRVYPLLERFGLKNLVNKHPYNLSRADQFRVVFASVMAMDPEIIIVDEPTTGQDLYQSYQIMNYLQEENKKGKTVIIITHHLRFISQFVPRVVILYYGNKIFDGTTRDAFANFEIMQKSMIDPPEISKLSYLLRQNGFPAELLNYKEYIEFLSKCTMQQK